MLYLVNTDSIPSLINTQSIEPHLINTQEAFLKPETIIDILKTDNDVILPQINKPILKDIIKFNIQPLPSTIDFDAEPMTLQSMPVGVLVQAYIVLALDPENIYLRLCSWVI